MIDNRLLELISQIGVRDIEQYLLNEKWYIDDTYKNEKMGIFKKKYKALDSEEDEEFEIIVPRKKSFSDYKARVLSLLETLSILEEKSKIEIISSIKDVNVDIFEMRLINDIFNGGTIPVNMANNITSFVRDMIVSSACVEENPRPLYQKPTKKAVSYGDIFRFGQTRQGSYVMTVHSDLDNDIKNVIINEKSCMLEEEIPFQRKVLRRLQKALYQVNNIEDNYGTFVKHSYINGINGNMCEALSKLKELKQDIEIEYDFKISQTVNDNEDIPSKIIINKDTFIKAGILVETFKKLQSNEEICVTAKIGSIDFDYESESRSAFVTINFLYNGDGKYHRAKLYVEDENYSIACDALKERLDIQVSGILDKSARKWCIDNIESFSIVEKEA